MINKKTIIISAIVFILFVGIIITNIIIKNNNKPFEERKALFYEKMNQDREISQKFNEIIGGISNDLREIRDTIDVMDNKPTNISEPPKGPSSLINIEELDKKIQQFSIRNGYDYSLSQIKSIVANLLGLPKEMQDDLPDSSKEFIDLVTNDSFLSEVIKKFKLEQQVHDLEIILESKSSEELISKASVKFNEYILSKGLKFSLPEGNEIIREELEKKFEEIKNKLNKN